MAMLASRRYETAKLDNINESLEPEHKVQAEIKQLLTDLKDQEAVAQEMIAILRGVRGPDARYDRKAAQKVLAKVKQRRVLAARSLRRSQNRLKSLEAQSANVNRAAIEKAQDAGRITIESPPITAEIHGTATHAAGHPSERISTARLRRVGAAISSENLLPLG